MLNLMKQEANSTTTENGAATYLTAGSDCMDLFATIGAIRCESDEEIITRFKRAYAEDPDVAMKTLFYARDIRGGLGERRVFRVILRWLAIEKPKSLRKNLEHISEYGRFDDLLVLLDTPCRGHVLELIREQLDQDLMNLVTGDKVSLLAKWMPSINASNVETIKNAKIIAKALNMDYGTYRKVLSRLRGEIRILENNLRQKDYSFEYEKQPSRAMLKYLKAFWRNDGERYGAYLQAVEEGKSKMNASAVFPYEVIGPYFTGDLTEEEKRSMNVTWNALDDFTNGENAIVVVDGSGSMYWQNPLSAMVAQSLGIYFAERNTGAFNNHFITFSTNPQLVQIKGKDIYEKVDYCFSFNEVADTNIEKVFNLLLKVAEKGNLKQKDMPDTVYIISDMEFNRCVRHATAKNFDAAESLFRNAGLKLPKIVFWNVASRNRQQPVTQDKNGVILVSGCTPNIFERVVSGETNPYKFMMEVLGSERYERIVA